ncbi:hypothetical protein DTO002I6_1601 [Penicillium roqueforti]|nr:hypothetical protein DTO002I6_1601 [Penicillium roqueforti]
MYSHLEAEGTSVTVAHCKAQNLRVVDRVLEPQTVAHFLQFAFGNEPLPNGVQPNTERLSAEEALFIKPNQNFPPDSDGEPLMTTVMSRIGSHRDPSRLCMVGKNLQFLKSRLWEGVIPLSDQLWQEKGLDRPKHFDFACQYLTAVIAVFQYLNEPTVRLYLRDTFNYIHEHWAALDTVLNSRRAEQGKNRVSVADLWTMYMAAHFEMMSERAHRWVTVHVNTLRAPLLRALLEHRPVDGGANPLGEPDAMQWKLSDALHMLAEITANADYTIMIPMNGYKGYGAAPPRDGPPALHAVNLRARSKAYHERARLLTREELARSAAAFMGSSTVPSAAVSYHTTSQCQIKGQNRLRKEIRGAPIEPIPREPWIAACASRIESGRRERRYGFAVYRLTYGQTESEWAEFVRKVEAHVSDWGKGQTGSGAIKNHLRLHWLNGKEFGIPEGDIDASRKHFETIKNSLDDWSKLQVRAFLAVDSACFASYTTNSYSAVTSRLIPGDFAGFLLAVDPEFDSKNGSESADESPGYEGHMRILGSLVWSDLYSLLLSQTADLEEYWPLASEHPNMVYVGPTIPWQRYIWKKHNDMRWNILRAVVDYVKRNPGVPTTQAPRAQGTLAAISQTAAASTTTPTNPAIPTPTAHTEQDPNHGAFRTFMLLEFQRYLRQQGHPRRAAMVDELLRIQPNEEPDVGRLRQLVNDENERQEQRRRDGLGEDEEASGEYRPDCPLQ